MAQNKSRQTYEELKREQAVRERRARKQERRLAKTAGTALPVNQPAPDDEGLRDPAV